MIHLNNVFSIDNQFLNLLIVNELLSSTINAKTVLIS